MPRPSLRFTVPFCQLASDFDRAEMPNTSRENIMRRLRLPILAAVVMICLTFVVLAVIEGAASLALFARSIYGAHLAEEHFTERDTLLGWISAPNTSKPNMFGAGKSLNINAQRFRHSGDVTPVPTAGKKRVVCSGDSFTLGYGVDDTRTWCALLASNEPSLETVNMGQGGYGIDQAYLWYVRDGIPLRPQVHVFSIIHDDFFRMVGDRFLGFPKPTLALDSGGRLRTVGVPVPNPGLGPFRERLLKNVRSLRAFQLLEALSSEARRSSPSPTSATWDVARVIFQDLAARDSGIGAKFVVVYLPTLDQFKGHASDKWRQRIREAAATDRYEFVDLVPDLRRLAPDSVDRLFIPPGELGFFGAAGHFTDAGNVWVERLLRERIPELDGATPSPRAKRSAADSTSAPRE